MLLVVFEQTTGFRLNQSTFFSIFEKFCNTRKPIGVHLKDECFWENEKQTDKMVQPSAGEIGQLTFFILKI